MLFFCAQLSAQIIIEEPANTEPDSLSEESLEEKTDSVKSGKETEKAPEYNTMDITVDVSQDSESPSPRSAALFSLLLPGSGHLYAGDRDWARNFLFAEAALITASFLSWKNVSDLETDARAFAAYWAGAPTNSGEKDEDYLKAVKNYNSLEAYNDELRRYKDYEDYVYPENEDYNWRWINDQKQQKFGEMMKDMWRARTFAWLVTGTLAANRIVSSIHSVFSAGKDRVKTSPSGTGLKSPSVTVYPAKSGGIMLRLSGGF